MSSIILSVCIPIYNRPEYLNRLLCSIDLEYASIIEIVLVDDGSTEDVYNVLYSFCSKFSVPYKYVRQLNSGVSKAMKVAYETSGGLYCIKMDSDDYFTEDGLSIIVRHISALDNNSNSCGFAFGVRQIKGVFAVTNKPPEILTNFIALRADYGVVGDLKEVVLRSIILENMYDVPDGTRRVPPSLLWAKIALTYDCYAVSTVVACKEYLENGISSNIKKLKFNGSEQMRQLYFIQQSTDRYYSMYYRILSRVLYSRYAFHSKFFTMEFAWMYVCLPFGFVLFVSDKINLFLAKFQRRN